MSDSQRRPRPGHPTQPAHPSYPNYPDPYRNPQAPAQNAQQGWPPQDGGARPDDGYANPDPYAGYPDPGAGQAADPYAEHDPHQGYPDPYAQQRAPQGQPRQTQYADPYRHPDEPAPVAEDPYSQPTLNVPHAPQGYGEQPGQNQSPYAARFEPYAAPGDGYGRQPQHRQQPPYPQHSAEPQQPALRGGNYDDWPATAPPETTGQPVYPQYPQGGQNWDQFADGEPAAHPGHSEQAYSAGYAEPGEPHLSWAQDGRSPYGGDAGADPYSPHLATGAPHGQEMAVDPDYDDYDDVGEETGSQGRSRVVTIVAALVGAIVVGGGLAYGYQTFVGGDTRIGAGPPVVRGDAVAAKSRPTDPGGRTFDNTDSQVLDRISSEGRTSGSRDANGTKRVPTVMIGRDGQVVTTGAAALPPEDSPREPVVSVPGLTVVDGFAAQRQAAAQGAVAPPAAGRPIVVTPPASPPTTRALSPVRPASVTSAPELPSAKPTPPAGTTTALNVPRAAPPKAQPTTPKARPIPAAPSGSGYVAVLASVPVSGTSRLEALKTFADIQQNYGSVLSNRTPDVREADLGARGRYHRLMVGPPSSRENANALCKQLKSAGYPSCWITAY